MGNNAKDSNKTWKTIPGFAGYEVSDQGQVRSYRKTDHYHEGQFYSIPHLLKPAIDQKGYRRVNLRRNGQTYSRKIATLVLLAFVGPLPSGMHGCHNNSNPGDDCLENLRYDTPRGNARDRLSLSDIQVIEMRERRQSGSSIATLAKLFNVKYEIAMDICRGKTYRAIGGPFTCGRWGNLTKDDVIAMRIERANGDITLRELGKKFGLSVSAVSRICRGERYPNDEGPITVGKSVRNRSKQDDMD